MNLTSAGKHPRLFLPVPEGVTWQLVIIGPNLHEAVVDPQVRLRVRALVMPTVEHMMWIEGIMLEETPAGATLKPVSVKSMVSPIGLPVVLAHYEVLGPEGTLFEERVGAFYAILHNRAEVVVHLRGGATWKDRGPALLPFILSGQIDWPEYDDELIVTQLGKEL